MFRYLAFVVVTVGLIAVAPGVSAGVQAMSPHGSPDPEAARAVAALAAGHAPTPASAGRPGSFEEVMGYVPVAVRLPDATVRAGKPAGACSAPDGGRLFGFEAACKAHDFGYDLLRYAAASGEPLGPGARRTLDDTLSRDLHASCRTRGGGGWPCHLVATGYVTAAQANSWRQGYGPPVPEPYLPWAIGTGAFLVLAAPAWLAVWRRRTAGSGIRRSPPAGRVWLPATRRPADTNAHVGGRVDRRVCFVRSGRSSGTRGAGWSPFQLPDDLPDRSWRDAPGTAAAPVVVAGAGQVTRGSTSPDS